MSVLPMHLRAYQEPTRDELTRLYFSVPPQEWLAPQTKDEDGKPIQLAKPPSWQILGTSEKGKEPMGQGTQGMEISAILSVEGKDEVYSGRLNLLPPFLCFISLDKRSARFSLPLYTIRRVERAGVFALSLATWHGMRLILQLTSLLPTAEHFSILLRDALKAQLPEMKRLKSFIPSLYSEFLLSPESSNPKADVRTAFDLINVNDEAGPSGTQNPDAAPGSTNSTGDLRGPGGEGRGTYDRGLGEIFGYPGDPRKLRERSKIKLWREYFEVHGRHLTLLRYPSFQRLLQVGLPSRLRGELWETLSGSIYLRYAHRDTYRQLIESNQGKHSQATDDIEKDLNRSLPEYKAYQTDEGLARLRRVLVAYSFRNPELGYCQALNIVVAGLLIYMSEEQAFWLLEILCDRIVPGYYSPSMEGTLLDQRVFEALVGRCLPMISEHFRAVDVQISVASLPWFLSLYINSMPLIFAFRVVDCVLAMGVKVLFQIGLAVLKINGEQLLEVTDDGMFISLMRNYFSTLGESAHPDHSDPRVRAITNFQELLVVSFREFNVITDETIISERRRFRAIISDEIESFSKRAAVRNLKSIGRFSRDQIGIIYDKFFAAVCANPDLSAGGSQKPTPPVTPGSAQDSAGRLETRIDLKTFRQFLSEVCTWARDEIVTVNAFVERTTKRVAEHEVIDRLFYKWDISGQGSLSLQDIVVGLDTVCFAGLMESLEWFFQLHDKDNDGYLTKDEVIQLSESLLFIFRNEVGDSYLASVSKFILNAFDFADAVNPSESQPDQSLLTDHNDELPASQNRQRAASASGPNNTPYLNELLESFFSHDLAASFRLEPEPEHYHVSHAKQEGLVGGLMNMVLNDQNRSRLNKFADNLGSAIGRHAEWRKPAIGKDPAQDLTIRESLLNTSQLETKRQRSSSAASKSTLDSALSTDIAQNASSHPRQELDMIRAAQEAVMHRPNFAIDAIGDSDPGSDDDLPADADDEEGVMAEVDEFLKTADTDEKGLSGEEKRIANDLLTAEPVK